MPDDLSEGARGELTAEGCAGEQLPRLGTSSRKDFEWRETLTAAYRELGSYSAVARRFGVTRQNVHQMISDKGEKP